jgi:hypothetical protein
MIKEKLTVGKSRSQLLAALVLLSLAGLPAHAFLGFGKGKPKDQVSIGDSNARTHLESELSIGDLMAFAETVTNKMLSSPRLADWPQRRPKLILGSLVNNTDNPNLRVNDMYDRIVEVIFNANVARVVDQSAVSFDYIVKSEISSNRQYGEDGAQLVEYVMTFKLFSVEGELQGQWSDRLNLVKNKRKLW